MDKVLILSDSEVFYRLLLKKGYLKLSRTWTNGTLSIGINSISRGLFLAMWYLKVLLKKVLSFVFILIIYKFRK